GSVRARPRPGATPLRHDAVDHAAVDQLAPHPVEHAVLVGHRGDHAALGVVLCPRAGPAVVGEPAGHPRLAGAVLDVRSAGLAVLVGRLAHHHAVDVFLDGAVELAALPALLERRHALGRRFFPAAVLEIAAVVT